MLLTIFTLTVVFSTRTNRMPFSRLWTSWTYIFHQSHARKALPFVKRRRLSHQSSNISWGVQPVHVRKKKVNSNYTGRSVHMVHKYYVSLMCRGVPRQPNTNKDHKLINLWCMKCGDTGSWVLHHRLSEQASFLSSQWPVQQLALPCGRDTQ